MNHDCINTTVYSKSRVVKALVWKFLERGGTQCVQFVIQIVLARLLCPDDYGVLAILMAFLAFSNVFVQSGLNIALIQKQDADETDFSSVFWLSFSIALVLYCFLFCTAPFIAVFFGKKILTPVLRVLAVTLFFGSLNSVQSAIVAKTMQFKRFFFSSMGGAIGSGLIGIIVAINGYGVWALVAQQLLNCFIITIILWFTVKWRPHLVFSYKKIQNLFSFGWKLLCSGIIGTAYVQIFNLTIGKIFTSKDLGYFNRGDAFPSIIATNLDGSIQSVILPALSSNNNDKNAIKQMVRRSMSVSSFLLLPLMFGMIVAAKPMVQVLLSDVWLPCVPFIQLSCFYFALFPFHTANLTAINAIGRSDIYLKLELVKDIIGVLIMFLSIRFGIFFMAISRIVTGLLSTVINAHPNKKLIHYSYFEQWKDVLPSLILSSVMAVCVYFVSFLAVNPVIVLGLQFFIGCIIYFGLAALFKLDVFVYLVSNLVILIK